MKAKEAMPGGGTSERHGFFDNPTYVRWAAHVAFWLLYFSVRTAAAAALPREDTASFPYLANRALVVSCYFLLTTALLVLVAGVRAQHSTWMRNVGIVLGALALAPVTEWCEQQGPFLLAGIAPEPAPLIGYVFQFGWVLLLWGFTQALLGYHFESMAQSRAIARAQTLAYDAQLRMLHYQINPHFLFNTLNAISTLVLEKRNAQAEEMLLRLAGFLRYSLDRQPTELAVLADELEAQRKYLEIEQTRLGDRLKIKFSVEPGLERARLPSLILQPILENAIKFAIAPRAEGGVVEVAASSSDGSLRVRVEDDGPGAQAEGAPRRRGVGLANARERLELIYGARAGMATANRQPTGFRVDIWLPLEVADHVG